MNHNKQRVKKRIAFGALFIIAVFGLPYVVMLLWNAILPNVIGVKTISYLQAIGIFILSKILFGGFRFGGKRGQHKMKQHFKNKLMDMSDEERQAFRQKWKERCNKF